MARHYELVRRLCNSMGWQLEVALKLKEGYFFGYAEISVPVMRSQPELGYTVIFVFDADKSVSCSTLYKFFKFGSYPSAEEFSAFVEDTCSKWLDCMYGKVWQPFKSVECGTIGGLFPYRTESELRLMLEAKGF